MKITISKSQWQAVGVKAGWINATSMFDASQHNQDNQDIPDGQEGLIGEVIRRPRDYRLMPVALRNDPGVMQRLKLGWLQRIKNGFKIYNDLPEIFKKDPDISSLVKGNWQLSR